MGSSVRTDVDVTIVTDAAISGLGLALSQRTFLAASPVAHAHHTKTAVSAEPDIGLLSRWTHCAGGLVWCRPTAWRARLALHSIAKLVLCGATLAKYGMVPVLAAKPSFTWVLCTLADDGMRSEQHDL
eukprot:SAG22_NODE_12858_length_427_cov_0.634146_1_plen_127_part_10